LIVTRGFIYRREIKNESKKMDQQISGLLEEGKTEIAGKVKQE